MKSIVSLLFFVFIALAAHSQELQNDTINCGNHAIILSLPERSIERAKISSYEEGFIKYYNLIIGNPSHIIVHYGALMKINLPEPDSLIYECKLGNVAKSTSFTHEGKYFRRDCYVRYGITIMLAYVNKEDAKLANYILDNIIIKKIR